MSTEVVNPAQTRFSSMSFLLLLLHSVWKKCVFLRKMYSYQWGAAAFLCSEEHYNGESWCYLHQQLPHYSSLLCSWLQQVLQQWVPQISQLSTNVFIIHCFMLVVLVFLICVMKTYEEESYKEHQSVCLHVPSQNWTIVPVFPLETSLCTIFFGLLSL